MLAGSPNRHAPDSNLGAIRTGAVGVCIAAIALGLSGCGASSPSQGAPHRSAPSSSTSAPDVGAATTVPTPTAGHALTGMGATLAAFKTAHPVDDSLPTVCSASNSCFGPELTNAQYGKTYQFINALIVVGLITGYQENFPPNTDLATAEADILQLMPADATMGALTVVSNSGNCAMFDITSPTLGSVFDRPAIGDPQGTIGVELSYITSGGNVDYEPNNIQEANLSPQPVNATGTC